MYIDFHHFYRVVILSVRLSVRPFVCHTPWTVSTLHMVRLTIMISSPYGSPIILVFRDIRYIPKFEGGHPERGHWMRVGWVRIGDFRPLSLRISKMVQDTVTIRLLLITNRKLNTRLVPKATTLVDPEMTLDGNYALCCITHMSFGANH